MVRNKAFTKRQVWRRTPTVTRLVGVPEYTGEAFHSSEPIKSIISNDAFLPALDFDEDEDEEEDIEGEQREKQEEEQAAALVSSSSTSDISTSSKSMKSRDSCSSWDNDNDTSQSMMKSKKTSFTVSFNHMVQVCFVPSRKDIGPTIKDLYWRGEDYETFKQEAIVEIRAFWKFVGSTAKYAITALYQPEYNWPDSFTDHLDHSSSCTDLALMAADKLIITGTSPSIPSPMLEMHPPPSMSQLKHVNDLEMVGVIDQSTGEVAVVVEGTMMKHVDSLSRLHYLDDSCFDHTPHSRTSSDCSGYTSDSDNSAYSFQHQQQHAMLHSPPSDHDGFVSAKYSWLDNESDADSIVSDTMDYAM